MISISDSGYAAEISEIGGALHKLRFQGRDLVEPFNPDLPPVYAGDLLAPWPNRIAGGKYSFEGTDYQLPINEIARNNSLHGLIAGLTWTVTSKSESSVTLSTILHAATYYPFEQAYVVTYSLSESGLTWTLAVENIGSTPAPYGASIHPYLIASPGGSVNDWSLTMPAREYMQVDADRLLPIAVRACSIENFEFDKERVINDIFIDHAFKVDINNPIHKIEVRAANREGVWMGFDSESHWIQIHTADRDGGATSRKCLAVEPMTCPPDAFNSGIDLIVLKPGQKHQLSWFIGAL
jgi:aldose 1-epimerase